MNGLLFRENRAKDRKAVVLHPVPHWEVLSRKYQVSYVTLSITLGPQDTVLTEPVACGSNPCLSHLEPEFSKRVELGETGSFAPPRPLSESTRLQDQLRVSGDGQVQFHPFCP